MFKKVLVALLLTTSVAYAQAPQPDVPFLQRAITVLQTQRNNALHAQLVAEAKLQGVTEDLNKALLKIKGLEEEAAKKAPDKQ